MDVSQDDLRAAVGAGTITEAQAASLLTLSRQRDAKRQGRDPLDEPFELFRGFNEIFIVVGLSILFSGYLAFTGAFHLSGFRGNATTDAGNLFAVIVTSLIGVIFVLALTRYFTLKRRMVGPSIVLALGMAYFTARVGIEIDNVLGFEFMIAPLAAAIGLGGYWVWSRIPFTLLLIAGAVLAFLFAIAIPIEGNDPRFEDLFILSQGGVFPYITLVFGLICLATAMYFDMQDRYRVSRNAANGFWLHVAAAPLIMNPIAATLFGLDTFVGSLCLLVFVLLMAAFAIMVDRRSFLLSGIGYLIALIASVLSGGWGLAILLLGLLLITLGAQWEVIRGRLLNALPDLPYKDRLPPWTTPNGDVT